MDLNLVGVNELSEKLGVPPSWIYARTRIKGPDAIPCIRVGKYIKFKIEDVIDWLESKDRTKH
jgi:hypothetical protein